MTNSSKFSFALLSAVIAVSGLTASPATAEAREVTIATSQYDLNSQTGANAFAQSVDRAIRNVCHSAGDRSAVGIARSKALRDLRQCRIDAAAAVAAQISTPATSAALDQRFPEADIRNADRIMTADISASSVIVAP
ncbi:MAG: UrcA family protein [Pseudomonadota bacterium]